LGYDDAANVLEVEFTTGRVYRYYAVPRSVVAEVRASDSVGAAFNRLVRDRYAYEEV
jgi:hypothetical protein